MNLPNKITLFRVMMIPVFLFFYMSAFIDPVIGRYAALAVFVAASASDALDGHIARSRNLITNFGKLMDPLADKLLVCAALIAMTARGVLPAWVVIVIVSREFYISGFRQLALEQNIVLAASFWAKIKTISQIVMILYLLIPFPDHVYTFGIKWALMLAVIALSIVSAVEYTVKNKEVFLLTQKP